MNLYKDAMKAKNPGRSCWCCFHDCDEKIKEKQYGVPANELVKTEYSKAETCEYFEDTNKHLLWILQEFGLKPKHIDVSAIWTPGKDGKEGTVELAYSVPGITLSDFLAKTERGEGK